MHFKKQDDLLVSVSYIMASREKKKKVSNKCDPDGFLNHLVSNHFLGASVISSCLIHNWAFARSRSRQEHQESDALFLNNMLMTVGEQSNNLIKRAIRKAVAYIYYGVVHVSSPLKYRENKG